MPRRRCWQQPKGTRIAGTASPPRAHLVVHDAVVDAQEQIDRGGLVRDGADADQAHDLQHAALHEHGVPRPPPRALVDSYTCKMAKWGAAAARRRDSPPSPRGPRPWRAGGHAPGR